MGEYVVFDSLLCAVGFFEQELGYGECVLLEDGVHGPDSSSVSRSKPRFKQIAESGRDAKVGLVATFPEGDLGGVTGAEDGVESGIAEGETGRGANV